MTAPAVGTGATRRGVEVGLRLFEALYARVALATSCALARKSLRSLGIVDRVPCAIRRMLLPASAGSLPVDLPVLAGVDATAIWRRRLVNRTGLRFRSRGRGSRASRGSGGRSSTGDARGRRAARESIRN